MSKLSDSLKSKDRHDRLSVSLPNWLLMELKELAEAREMKLSPLIAGLLEYAINKVKKEEKSA